MVVLEQLEMASPAAAFGLYVTSSALYSGAEALRAARFRQTDISVMYSDGCHAIRLRDATGEAEVADDDDSRSLPGLLSALSGIGAFVMAEDGPYMAGGPILATLSGGPERLLPALRGLGLPDHDIPRVEGRLREGGLLLLVHCDDAGWLDRAQRILLDTGAEHVSATAVRVTIS